MNANENENAEEEKEENVKKEEEEEEDGERRSYLEPLQLVARDRGHWNDGDEDDSRYFMSEPSLSDEEATHTEPTTAPNIHQFNLLSPRDSTTGTGIPIEVQVEQQQQQQDGDDPTPPPPPSHEPAPYYASPFTVISSPGNTSLSSRDSPHFHKKVQLQFLAEHKRSRFRIDPISNTALASSSRALAFSNALTNNNINQNNKDDDDNATKKSDLIPSANSSISIGQQIRAAEFFEELKVQSIGSLQDAASNDLSETILARADQTQIDNVMRRRRHLIHPTPTPTAAVPHSSTPDSKDRDETIVMTLSDSDGEVASPKSTDDDEPLDWEQQNSADDEKTFDRPRRRRISAPPTTGEGTTGGTKHRRTRSGDGLAATLLTGGNDWKGMQKGHLPLPPEPTKEDDDDFDEMLKLEKRDTVAQLVPHAAATGVRRLSQRSQHSGEQSSEDSSSACGFSIGIGGITKRKGRRTSANRARVWSDEIISPRQQQHIFNVTAPAAITTNIAPYGLPNQPRRSSSSSIDVPLTVGFQSFMSSGNDSVRSVSTLEGPEYDSPKHPRKTISDDSFRAALQQNYEVSQNFDFMPPPPMVHGSGVYDNSMAYPASPIFVHAKHARRSSDSSHPSRGSIFSWVSSKESGHLGEIGSTTPNSDHARMYRIPQVRTVESEEEEDEEDTEEENSPRHISRNRLQFASDRLESVEEQFESRSFRGNAQSVWRSRISLFGVEEPKVPNHHGRKKEMMMRRASFKPVTNVVDNNDDRGEYPTFVCPQCGLRQREFFTVVSAPTKFLGAPTYLAFYFGLYVVASLYIFGLEEGWSSLDCVYFAVMTMTTAGLGDLVPTTSTAKIICSIFIYFGVACIGLLLGTYLAGMLDERSRKLATKTRVNNCVVCSQVLHPHTGSNTMHGGYTPKSVFSSFNAHPTFHSERAQPTQPDSGFSTETFERKEKRRKRHNDPISDSVVQQTNNVNHQSVSLGGDAASYGSHSSGGNLYSPGVGGNNLGTFGASWASFNSPNLSSPTATAATSLATSARGGILGSPMTAQILGRQTHTRHISLDVSGTRSFGRDPSRDQWFQQDQQYQQNQHGETANYHPTTIYEHGHSTGTTSFRFGRFENGQTNDETSEDDSLSYTSSENFGELRGTFTRLRTAKYVLLTLREALMNSVLIIAIGSIGFYFIENMNVVDSFYFTTVLLTTVGYGDIAPKTNGGKLFATIYVLVAGTVLLNNMSLISMIPLELRKRRIEKAVLNQFGDQLDDAGLRELATGPLVQRLKISRRQRADGLEECTSEMFALAMLIRLGKVTEREVRETYRAFERLDKDNEGVLTSRSIIAGMMRRRKSQTNLKALLANSSSPSGRAMASPGSAFHSSFTSLGADGGVVSHNSSSSAHWMGGSNNHAHHHAQQYPQQEQQQRRSSFAFPSWLTLGRRTRNVVASEERANLLLGQQQQRQSLGSNAGYGGLNEHHSSGDLMV